MLLPERHFAARQFGVGRTCSGPTGYKMKPGRILSRAKGDQQTTARKNWIWSLYATQANLRVPQADTGRFDWQQVSWPNASAPV